MMCLADHKSWFLTSSSFVLYDARTIIITHSSKIASSNEKLASQ